MYLLELIYKLIIAIRNYLYDRNFIKSIETNAKVISIGNITTGGSGKTPMVIYISKLLRNEYKKIIIVTGGYKRESNGFVVLSSDTTEKDIKKAGDESVLLAQNTGLDVVVDNKKWKAAQKSDKMYKPDLIILDDGFQHRKLHRHSDILIYDKSTAAEKHLLPKGRLREPKNNINRANIIIARDLPKEDIDTNKVIFQAKYRAGEIINVFTNKKEDVQSLSGFRKVAFSGIAKPDNFIKLLTVNELFIEKHIEFKDHHNYSSDDVLAIIDMAKSNNSNTVITTEKDAVKIRRYKSIFIDNDINLYTLGLEVHIENEEGFKTELLKELND